MTELGFAVIGCGTVSGYGHLPTIDSMAAQGLRLAAVVDTNPERLAEVAAKYPRARALSDYRQALAMPDVAAVVVATLVPSHAPITADAVRAGKHVLLEKPPAADVPQCQDLLAEVQRCKRLCAVNFILRYQPAYLKMAQALRDGEIGRLRAMRLIDDWWGADHRNPASTRQARLMKDNTVMSGEGIHYVDLVRWFSGSEFGPLQCMGVNIQGHANPDHMALLSVLADGTMVNLETSHGYGFSSKDGTQDRQLDLIGQNGVIKCMGHEKVIVHGKSKTETVEFADGKAFTAFYSDFADSIRQGAYVKNLPTLADGLAAMKVVVAADAMAKNN